MYICLCVTYIHRFSFVACFGFLSACEHHPVRRMVRAVELVPGDQSLLTVLSGSLFMVTSVRLGANMSKTRFYPLSLGCWRSRWPMDTALSSQEHHVLLPSAQFSLLGSFSLETVHLVPLHLLEVYSWRCFSPCLRVGQRAVFHGGPSSAGCSQAASTQFRQFLPNRKSDRMLALSSPVSAAPLTFHQ